MDNNSAFVHPASLPNRKLSHPSRMLTPKVDFSIFLSSSVHCEFIRELYTRMVSKCKMLNGSGAIKPSSAWVITDMSSSSRTASSPSKRPIASIFLAVILKNGPTLVVVNRKPFLFAIRSNSSLVTYASFVSSFFFFFLSSDDEDDEDDEDEDDAALVSPLLHLLLLSPSTPTARGGPFSPPPLHLLRRHRVDAVSPPSSKIRCRLRRHVVVVVVVVVVIVEREREREKKNENERERERQPFLRRRPPRSFCA